MRVKLLLLGIAFFVTILDKSDATNKMCYHAKICIHNGKEKCGQDMKGKVRRFLDSCDMKEYNCLKNTRFAKTNAKNCCHLPPIDKKLSADDIVNHNNDDGNKSGSNVNESRGDDDEAYGASNMNVDLTESGEIKYDRASQEVGVSNGDGADPVSKEDASGGESKVDSADEASREEIKYESGKENAVTSESIEDGASKVSKEDEISGANEEQIDDADDVNETCGETEIAAVDGANKESKVNKDNIITESKRDDDDDEADQASEVDKTDEVSNEAEEKCSKHNKAEKLYYGLQEEDMDTTDETDEPEIIVT